MSKRKNLSFFIQDIQKLPIDILRNEIIGENLNNEYQLSLLCQVSKFFFKIVHNWKETSIYREKKEKRKRQYEKKGYESIDFYFFIDEFISRPDFESINIRFKFANDCLSFREIFKQFCNLDLFQSVKYICKKNKQTRKLFYLNNRIVLPNLDGLDCGVKMGHLEIVEFLFASGDWNYEFDQYKPQPWCIDHQKLLFNAVFYGHLHILKFLLKVGSDFTDIKIGIQCASANGHLECLKYLHEEARPYGQNHLDNWSCQYASRGGHLTCLKYLHEKNYPWDRWSCINASLKGNLDILKYLHENKCPWDKDCCFFASENGWLNCLIYLFENGCEYNKQECLDNAKNQEIKEYIFKNM